jgi:phosphoesterase RecJ-like protein
LGAVLESLRTEFDGRLAMLDVTRAMLDEVHATDDMVEGMVNYGRMLRGVEIAALLWEWPGENGAQDIKVSLRSRGTADISLIAVALGGGGHRNAAGAQCNDDLETVAARIRDEALAILGPVC